MLLGVVVPELPLQGVGAQQGVCDEGAGQPARSDVLPQLEAQQVPAETRRETMSRHTPTGTRSLSERPTDEEENMWLVETSFCTSLCPQSAGTGPEGKTSH